MKPEIDLSNMANWRSLTTSKKAAGYSVAEAQSRFPRERFAENALRLGGVFLMLAGYVQWFLHGGVLPKTPVQMPLQMSVQMPVLLTVLFVGSGLAAYLMARRGFRRALQIEIGKRQIVVARVNSKGRSMIRRSIPMNDVESFYVRRDDKGLAQTTLNVRLKDQSHGVALLAGKQEELQALHTRLCADVHTALGCVPRRVTSRSPGRASKLMRQSVRPSRPNMAIPAE